MSGGLTLVLLCGVFLLGIVVVIYSVEVFIDAVGNSATSLGISGFFLAVVLAGIDLENAVLGITAASIGLSDLALGTVFGEAIFVLAVAVGLAGVFVPFDIDVPRGYLLLLALVPLPALAASVTGAIHWPSGLILLSLFVPLLGAIYRTERESPRRYVVSREANEFAASVESDSSRSETGDLPVDFDIDLTPEFDELSGRANLVIAIIATAGLTLGSFLTVVSAEGIFETFGIAELAFGATVLSFIASIEELALTIEPVRRGRPRIAAGNVVGSTVFYMTANVGIIAIIGSVATTGPVMALHWPIFGASLLVVLAMLARGRVSRVGGAILLFLYGSYWIGNFL